MAFTSNGIFIGSVVVLFLTMNVNASCPTDCQCDDTTLTCHNYHGTEVPLTSEVGGRSSIQFYNCWYETNVRAIVYENTSLLIIDNCAVTSLPERSFSALAALEQLTVTGNRIQSVDLNAFSGLSRLQSLDLSNNKLMSLPGGVFEPLTGLKTLDLGGNDQLVTVDWASLFGKPSASMTSFLCNRCGLQQVPVALFEKVPNLTRLELNGNNFSNTSVPFGGRQVFRPLSKLTLLSLEGNNLKELDREAFTELSGSLQTLRLGDNKLSDITDTKIRVLQHLLELTLHDNLLVTLNKDDLPQSLLAKGVTNSLELSGNPWNCHSDLIWLRNLEQSKIIITDWEDMRCSSPVLLKGQQLYSASIESFQTKSSSPSNVAVAAVILWVLTAFVVLVLFIRRVYIKRKQRSSPSRYANVPGSGVKAGSGNRV